MTLLELETQIWRVLRHVIRPQDELNVWETRDGVVIRLFDGDREFASQVMPHEILNTGIRVPDLEWLGALYNTWANRHQHIAVLPQWIRQQRDTGDPYGGTLEDTE